MIETNNQARYQTFLAVYAPATDQGEASHQPVVDLDIEKSVASVKLPNKQEMKAKFDAVFENPSREQIYGGIQGAIEKSFKEAEDLAVFTQGFSSVGETLTVGNYNTPGEGLVHFFARDLTRLQQPGDQIKFSYLNVYQEDIFDYLGGSEIRFGLIDFKRSFSGHKEHSFTLFEDFAGVINGVKPFHSDSHQTMGGYSRSCIPLIRFEVTRDSKAFSVEFYILPNSEKCTPGVNKTTEREVTCCNNAVFNFTNVLKAISQNNKHVPFNSSILTKLVKPFFQKKSGRAIMINHFVNQEKVKHQVIESILISKYLRSITKTFNDGHSEIGSTKKDSKSNSKNFFTEHERFGELKL